MSQRKLKQQLIHLGHQNPELRGHLRPILAHLPVVTARTQRGKEGWYEYEMTEVSQSDVWSENQSMAQDAKFGAPFYNVKIDDAGHVGRFTYATNTGNGKLEYLVDGRNPSNTPESNPLQDLKDLFTQYENFMFETLQVWGREGLSRYQNRQR